jgi:hypothetical protein
VMRSLAGRFALVLVPIAACASRGQPTVGVSHAHDVALPPVLKGDSSTSGPVAPDALSSEWMPQECKKAESLGSDSRRLVLARLNGVKASAFAAPAPYDTILSAESALQPYAFALASQTRYRLGRNFVAALGSDSKVSGIGCPRKAGGVILYLRLIHTDQAGTVVESLNIGPTALTYDGHARVIDSLGAETAIVVFTLEGPP